MPKAPTPQAVVEPKRPSNVLARKDEGSDGKRKAGKARELEGELESEF